MEREVVGGTVRARELQAPAALHPQELHRPRVVGGNVRPDLENVDLRAFPAPHAPRGDAPLLL